MKQHPPSCRRDQAGFTLVELLVVLALLSLIMTALITSMRFGFGVWQRTRVHAEGMEEISAVQALLRNTLEEAYPFLLSSDASHPRIDFKGEGQRMAFLAPAPSALIEAGRAREVLENEQDDDGLALVLSVKPELADDRNLRRQVLLRGLGSVNFIYFGADGADDAPTWHNSWTDKKVLPSLIGVVLTFPDGDPRIWPEMTIRPRLDADVACVWDPLTKYCRGR